MILRCGVVPLTLACLLPLVLCRPAGAQWTKDGVAVCTATGSQFMNQISEDGGGGAFVVWGDPRGGGTNDIYVQRFDAAGGAIVVWGDTRDYGATQSDIYAGLVRNEGTVAALLGLASASAELGRVRLEWYAATGAGLIATVHRRARGGAWEARATASPDGTGRLLYEDRAVTAGARYGYRLGVGSGAGERFFGEVWVDVPADVGLALGGVRPNPSPGELWVSFSLPDDAPAELALSDLAGRRLAARPVGGFGPGNHVARLEPGLRLRPGVYLVELTRGARSLTSRATIVR